MGRATPTCHPGYLPRPRLSESSGGMQELATGFISARVLSTQLMQTSPRPQAEAWGTHWRRKARWSGAAGRGAGLVCRVAGKFWPPEAGACPGLVLFGRFPPPGWPSPATCAKECAWERRPEPPRPPEAASAQVWAEGHGAQEGQSPSNSLPYGRASGVSGNSHHAPWAQGFPLVVGGLELSTLTSESQASPKN